MSTQPKTGYVYHTDFLKHRTGTHPESHQRLIEIMHTLKESNILNSLTKIEPRYATKEEIELVHAPHYIQDVENFSNSGGGYLDTDTPVCKESYNVATLAVGGLLSLVDGVMNEKINNGFALIRPPGHHAEKDRASGFCLFNNVAIAARYVQKNYKIKRVLIIDWDIHHGNGTQNVFYEDKSVVFFSTHQYPYYPGTGGLKEIGKGDGLGYTINVPLSSGCGDKSYKVIFERILYPVVKLFKPEIIFVSAGFDAHYADPLGGMELSEKGYEELTRIVKNLSDEICNGRLIFVLEGGYNLKALSNSVLSVFKVLANLSLEIEDIFNVPEEKNASYAERRIYDVQQILKNYLG